MVQYTKDSFVWSPSREDFIDMPVISFFASRIELWRESRFHIIKWHIKYQHSQVDLVQRDLILKWYPYKVRPRSFSCVHTRALYRTHARRMPQHMERHMESLNFFLLLIKINAQFYGVIPRYNVIQHNAPVSIRSKDITWLFKELRSIIAQFVAFTLQWNNNNTSGEEESWTK